MFYVLTHRFPLSEFLFCGHKEIVPLLLPTRKLSFGARMMKRIQFFLCYFLHINFFFNFFPSEIYEKLRSLKKEDSLIFVGESLQMSLILSRICPNVKKIAYFWNPCSRISKCESHIKRIKCMGFSIATFDNDDAKKYNLIFAPQFYREIPPNCLCNEIKNDFFFCGKNKGRKDFLLKLEHVLSSRGSCNFIIPERNDAMQYLDYIEELKRSRILCDVNQNGQSGLTLRVLESLFFQKKLITNNENIYNYDFFKESNILVINESISREKIEKFLSIPFEPYNVNVLKKYEVTNVLRGLTND